jgi:hypothetical protein
LSYWTDFHNADDATKILLGNDENKPEIPYYFLIYRKLKKYGGTLPFLWEGGYMDQPYLATICIERCISVEQDYEYSLKAKANEVNQKPESNNPSPTDPRNFE